MRDVLISSCKKLLLAERPQRAAPRKEDRFVGRASARRTSPNGVLKHALRDPCSPSRTKPGRSEIANYVVIKGNIHDIRQFTPIPPIGRAFWIR